jgi:hypothetical protein
MRGSCQVMSSTVKKTVEDLKTAISKAPGAAAGTVATTVSSRSPGPTLKRGQKLLNSARS